MRTREQKYAAQIFAQVEGLSEAERKEYGSMAHKLPVLVRTAGLAQALAFVEARGKPPHHKLLDHIAAVTMEDDGTLSDLRQKLLQRSRGAVAGYDTLGDYMRLTQQVLAALVWYKRFAQSVLGVTSTDEAELDHSHGDAQVPVETVTDGGAA